MNLTSRPRSAVGHPTNAPSPLRHASTASSNSSEAPSRSSTISSNASAAAAAKENALNRRRGASEVATPSSSRIPADGMRSPSPSAGYSPTGNSPAATYQSIRQSLKPLSRSQTSTPLSTPTLKTKAPSLHSRSHSVEDYRSSPGDGAVSPPPKLRPQSIVVARSDALGRSGSVRDSKHERGKSTSNHVHFSPHIEKPDLKELQKSSTDHLRTLSKFDNASLTITPSTEEVVGMHGRHRLRRGDSVRIQKTATGWAGRNWMDQQRQFLQAYEYLCHIGEAKEWIEDVIQKQIPPIVRLEEALRDGVTLAEVVQALKPNQKFRIFHNQKLQFRHSDNIAIFFRYLREVELPDLFWFELVDLYEKKNIPKVIYCIHALSWLLFRKGIVDFRIGNLVGHLQFENHELEATQKGLDKAGISMPNFSGMGANFGAEPEPEPEPVETEEERIRRELSEHEEAILDFQSQIRGAVARLRLGGVMQELWDAEPMIAELQAKIRGDMAREISQYRLDMRKFAVNLQSSIRGFLVRDNMRLEEDFWKASEKQVVMLQSLARAQKARVQTSTIRKKVQRHENGIRQIQAAIRGALARRDVSDDVGEAMEAEAEIQDLQAAIRGALVRRRAGEQHERMEYATGHVEKLQALARGVLQRRVQRADQVTVRQHESMVTQLQAAARALLARKETATVQSHLQSQAPQWERLQSAVRGQLARKHLLELREALTSHTASIIDLQSTARGFQERRRIGTLFLALERHEDQLLLLQSIARGHLFRQKYLADVKTLKSHTPAILELQSIARGFRERERVFDVLSAISEEEEAIEQLQSLARAFITRRDIGKDLMVLEDHEELISELQTLARGKIVRTQFVEKMNFYKENMKKVIKIQSFVRGRQQGEAYKTLTSGKNPPVGTVKNFVHLLNDSDFDFDEEIEFERLRKTVVHQVRQNELAEQYVDQLDVKIALLVKNKITLDEVLKHQKHFGGHVGNLLTNKDISSKDPFDLKALNKNSRKKLEHYQELFFMLQTQSQYLARLFKKLREQGMAEQESKRVELLMMGIFGFAQKRREEYYLLKLIARSIKEEVESCDSLQDYLRGNFFWNKLLSSYIRSPRDRKYLRDLLGPIVKEDIIGNEGLDLESDPMQIYRSAINNEELRTGQRSRRRADIPREEAIRDPETRETFVQHLRDLRDIADHFFLCLEEMLNRMPYGIRFVAQQTFETLCAKFPHEAPQHILTIVGQWLWKTYILPPLLAPDTWGVIERGLSPMQKRNLGEVAKVVGQIAAGRLFGGQDVYLQPINPYISEALGRIEEIWTNLINVRDAEAQFDIDEFNDLYARTKPTLYMKLNDVFDIHQMVSQEIPTICPSPDDPLREVIRELGSAKNNENDMLHVSSSEITLTLNPKFHDVEDADAEIKALFMETKRCVLYIIRIQTGSNLLDILVRPITDEDEDKWAQLVHDELQDQHSNPQKRANPYQAESSLLDITTITYAQLKRMALENILDLEKTGRITRSNFYQDILNAIAIDIRTKHRRRVQRSREMDNVRATLAALQEKATWLDSQLKSYNDYIEQAMVTLQQKSKGKKRFLLPFTKQYNHERELAKAGRVPRFGSFKYSARNLAEKGVLVAWRGYSERQWDKINITISSDEVGVFYIEGSMGSLMIPGAAASVPLDDLLQAQFNNCQFMNLFGEDGPDGKGRLEGPLRLNVNLLVHLLMRKFYRDE